MSLETVDQVPLGVTFADLFDNIGTDQLGYSARAGELAGRDVVIEGYLAHVHAHGPAAAATMLVDQPGLCPDCSPVPPAAITLLDASRMADVGAGPVRVIGRLDFGFRIIDGVASFIRIERASIAPGLA